ncbi:MAG: pseudouridine synthase, RluA family [Myxococcales bacterium]|nr:pseudouridine synthase, RluA family [Myxococcales bacterium]
MGEAQIPEREVIELDILVPSECEGWRLDHFLKRRIGRLSRTKIQTIIETQISFPDGRRVRPAAAVRAGDVLLLRRPAPNEPDVPREFGILYEDEEVLAIDKPAGLPMHTTAKFWRNTLTALLRERYPAEPMQIAHRIDRETSGVLLVARTSNAASVLSSAFERRQVSKTYLALVKGAPPDEGVIDLPLKLLETPTHLMMGGAADGLPAVTRFHVVRRFAEHALCEAHPETGRQHQIRVHFASLGHPIVGDKLYGASEALFMRSCDEGVTPELLAAFDGLARHALHAHRITFPHPITRAPTTVESPLPPDLVAYMAALPPVSAP